MAYTKTVVDSEQIIVLCHKRLSLQPVSYMRQIRCKQNPVGPLRSVTYNMYIVKASQIQ